MRGALATDPSDLAVQAAEVLRRNDMGEWTRASPTLYPHQWSWDTGFIAIGLAHLDTCRAARELTSLFAHQWRNGKVPHIVFNPDAPPDSYFPGAEHWSSGTKKASRGGSCERSSRSSWPGTATLPLTGTRRDRGS